MTAEKTNEAALSRNAASYPKCAALVPPSSVPMVTVAYLVVWVSEFAVCSSSLVAITGRIEARPLVKNGEANISSPLKT